ncbi:hypothetical protein [Streptomyces pactum]|uniref:UL36 very large tegument protein n=1 Tax=Streptomyces pactum TaxID=68249 RepID=A0A1S6J4N5_9ACTN|nr:hypothetical protein [Streptomyces pactum]AQS66712.1 hypothetical protein B1H29_07010 [Streptomyces pactum]
MAVEQLPGRVGRFARYLTDLLALLDQGGGWCGVFRQRDPDGMRACLDGREVPPWDVVEALLQDFAGRYGAPAATAETDRARTLHAAALTAYDSLPDARETLGDRLDVMLREQRYAAERRAELGRLLAAATDPEAADALRLDLAWARDDHARATARCAEIRDRMTELDRRTAAARPGEPGNDAGIRAPGASPARAGEGAPESPEGEGRTGGAAGRVRRAAGPAQGGAGSEGGRRRGRRRGGARFAGVVGEDAAPASAVPDHVPGPLAAPAAEHTPRGARFAGTAGPGEQPAPRPGPPAVAAADEAAAGRLVEALTRLRAEERGGEAHALLAEAANGPAARFAPLAAHLEQAGLGADWTTLLWEAASLPAERLVAVADALAAAGRATDAERILRQGVARPATEIGAAVLGLVREGRRREARALLDACVRARTPEEAARSAEPAPPVLVPLLLEAAHGVSDERHRDLVHALRVAGFAT